MVLDHVRQRASFLIIAPPAVDADGFRRGDLYIVHIPAIPDRLEDPVAEAEGQDVLHRLFSEVMVDAVNFAFIENLVQPIAQLLCACQIMPEGFFHDQAMPTVSFSEASGADALRRSRILTWLNR